MGPKVSGLTYKSRAKWKMLRGIYSAIYGEVNVSVSVCVKIERDCTGLFISPSGISDPYGTVAGMVTPKGSMSTEGETLQDSVLPYRCSIFVDF